MFKEQFGMTPREYKLRPVPVSLFIPYGVKFRELMKENISMEELTIEQQIDDILDKLRPFLQREGGDIELDHFDESDGTCYVKMVGACNGCAMASSDVSDSVAVLLMDELPQIKDVKLIEPEHESFEDLLRRLKEQEQANRELEEYNRQHRGE